MAQQNETYKILLLKYICRPSNFKVIFSHNVVYSYARI